MKIIHGDCFALDSHHIPLHVGDKYFLSPNSPALSTTCPFPRLIYLAPRLKCSNAELIDEITGVDFMSNSAQSITSAASDGISDAGHSVAFVLRSVNDMVANDAWSTFEKVLGIGEDFAALVGPLINPLSPVTDLLKKKIKMPWPGKIKKKVNLGKVACSPKSKVGYDSKKGTFGDKCWEKVRSHSSYVYMHLPILFCDCPLDSY